MNNVSSIRNTASDDAQPETMPHSIEAEQQLLGAILTNNDIFDRIASIIGPQHFYEPVHGRIAYFFVDAMRFEMAADLIDQLEGADDLCLLPAIGAELPQHPNRRNRGGALVPSLRANVHQVHARAVGGVNRRVIPDHQRRHERTEQ